MNLGDDPMFLVNVMVDSLHSIFGEDAPLVQVAIVFILFAYFIIKMRLDRGAIVLGSILIIGLLLYFGILPPAMWFVLVLGIAAYATYGILTLTKEEGG